MKDLLKKVYSTKLNRGVKTITLDYQPKTKCKLCQMQEKIEKLKGYSL